MKKIARTGISIVALVLVLLFAPFVTSAYSVCIVSAESESAWARIEKENVYFYERADTSSGLFILPCTYFVQLLGETGNFYEVQYLSGERSVRGYCRKTEVCPVDYTPQTPFLEYRTEVRFNTNENDLPPEFITQYTVPALFYGTFLYGSAVFYYVNVDSRFGYVSAAACPPLEYPPNTEHSQPIPETKPQPAEGKEFGALNVVLVCALSVTAIAAVYVLFRPSKLPKPQVFDDAEDVF